MANKTLKIKNLKQTIIISTDKKRRLVNKCGLPLRFKVPKGYTINKQAKRDSKASYGHSVCDSLFLSAYERANNSDMNSGHSALVDIHSLSSQIGIDPDTLYRGVAEIIATRKSEVIE